MSVKTYSNSDNIQLSEHFNVQEFRCKCGKNHNILLADELINKLEELFAVLDCSKIIVTSGYRCPEHDADKNVGGNGCGQHTRGTAADVCCYGQDGKPVSSKIVCCKAQDLGFTGITNINGEYIYTHLDVRENGTYFGDETTGNNTVTSDFYSYFGISANKIVANGIDVSEHQGVIDWDKVKSDGVQFAILRAGYGKESSQVDRQFERNYSECKRLNIPVGAYWYSYATTAAEAVQEATVCLSVLAGKQFEYPIAFDIEEKNSLANADELCNAFCSEIEKAGYYTAIYSFKSAFDCNISSTIKEKYDVFLSHIGVEQTDYSGNYGIWQYSWTGKINGISGDVDLDYAYKDYPSIIKSAGLNGFSADSSSSESPSDKNTLEKILEHVSSIDKKMK
ncbi:MAG: D-Ala-D-Ala carboxypeptidase family metallohydrolase [Ruminococcus flavefaciens]|nr:D-Ala-D-Ala carboxypeptidase family metallohydrolase [Ruminococcus flavefaciens]MCM1229987.1 D-Ala-D-Ala carboxypeptidase family metallohydrolase [Ruminococcus flavefaciens]